MLLKIFCLVVFCATTCLGLVVPKDEGEEIDFTNDEVLIPSRMQKSYPIPSLSCFPDGIHLFCNCDDDEYFYPCCRDPITGDCYLPTFYMWSEWLQCEECNDLCDETEECRIKYEDVGPGGDEKDSTDEGGEIPEIPGLPWEFHPRRSCRVQRTECRAFIQGTWGDWESTGPCSETCTHGMQPERRDCIDQNGNPVGAEYCPEDGEGTTRLAPCNTHLCPVLGEWEQVDTCYTEGETCLTDFERVCDGPPGSADILPECATDSVPCEGDCALVGQIDYVYGEYANCDSDCESGDEYAEGTCVYIIDEWPATGCDPDLATISRPCDTHLCPQFSEWTPDGDCSETCGGGVRDYTRVCLVDGKEIPKGCDTKQEACNTRPCETNYGVEIEVGEFSDSGTTSSNVIMIIHGEHGSTDEINLTDLGVDLSTPSTTISGVINDVLDVGEITSVSFGHDNTGKSPELYLTSLTIADIDGDETEFPCHGYIPQPGDKTPPGETVMVDMYPDTHCYPENFEYEFDEWSDCSSNCEPGTQSRNGTCIDTSTSMPSENCEHGAEHTETRNCNEDYCITYSEWTPVGSCTEICGGGEQQLIRTCEESGEVLGKLPDECTTSTEACNEQGCPELGNWGEWSACSNDCTPGTSERSRPCYEEGTKIISDECAPEDLTQTQDCNVGYCESYTEYVVDEDAPCLGNLESCQDPVRLRSRTCQDAGEAPDECLTSYSECVPDYTELELDITLILDNSDVLEVETCATNNNGIQHPDKRLEDETLLPVFTSQQNFLQEFLCTFPLIDPSHSIVRVYENSQTVGPGACGELTAFLDIVDDLSTVFEERSLNCDGFNFVSTLYCPYLDTDGFRAGKDALDIIVLPPIQGTVPELISDIFPTTAPFIKSTFYPTDARKLAVITYEDADELSVENKAIVSRLACLDDGVNTCSHYLGGIKELTRNTGAIVEAIQTMYAD